jgi:hypothetical protein
MNIVLLHSICLHSLKTTNRANKFGFRQLGQFLFYQTPVQNDIDWLSKHLYCVGLDKASNNTCFICIKHIRLQALKRLMGKKIASCKTQDIWALSMSIFDLVKEQFLILSLNVLQSSMLCPI